MFRRHFSTIVFLGLVVSGGALAGVFWLAFAAFMHLPAEFVFVASPAGGLAVALLADPIERALTARYEERQRRQGMPDFRIDEGDQR
ncbi:hypothetical protein [Streptomyces sp. NPDC060366]|uniref:hypothetical protein n=1 Tax=Streptomyces sp. NPDC060366 TaxID=3347105 RepID=UPI0036549DCD